MEVSRVGANTHKGTFNNRAIQLFGLCPSVSVPLDMKCLQGVPVIVRGYPLATDFPGGGEREQPQVF